MDRPSGAKTGLKTPWDSSVAGLRQDIASQRFEILKWAFLFWVGQLFAVASLIAVLIRHLRPAGRDATRAPPSDGDQ
ncbi:MAG: hypothetical protein HYZ58_04535 [Acidobacteria bacterium]|nr:hypothetical protein [Acidobacteriota bacterium]MBI3262401.1 hypothetical protein [Acidobacteriota bacterium]